jgi:ubiquinone/menaquinone biosynthesis C-methylase UbiE
MEINDEFINIQLSKQTIDKFYIRTSIKEAIDKTFSNFQGKLLDIGCGKMPYKKYILDKFDIDEYIGLDIQTALVYDSDVKPDVYWDANIMPFADFTFDCAFGTEVLEHCPDVEIILKETYRVLKPKGYFFFTIPFLWNLHEVPHDYNRFTPYSMQRHLEKVGFRVVIINSLGGWHSAMAQMLGLWAKRSNMSKVKRIVAINLLLPMIKYLLKKGKDESRSFREGQMITGLYGLCIKE